MKKFLLVLEFELKEYLRNKAFVITTLVIAILGAGVLFLPSLVDMSKYLPVPPKNGEAQLEEEEETEEETEEVQIDYYISDANRIVPEELIIEIFGEGTYQYVEESQIKEAIENETIKAGFVLRSLDEMDYYVLNKGMMDMESQMMESALVTAGQLDYCKKHNIEFEELNSIYNKEIIVNEKILGKDTESNFWYCYAFEILVFMMIVLYGQMIAVSVTTEKSNRSIEVLVTSTTPTSLLFGKVIAGAIASVMQVGIVLICILGSYQINREAWGGSLDMIFNIPAEVIVTFAFFGLGGFLFYAFLHGAMGALVSKTEDISKAVSGLMIVIMVVYMLSLMQLSNVDGIIIRVLSFLPVSSYSAMFARIAMGSVSMAEVIISGIILIVSIIGAGWIGALIYRMGTLRYGNPIKLSKLLKEIKNEK